MIYSDADFMGDLCDRKSTNGFVCILNSYDIP